MEYLFGGVIRQAAQARSRVRALGMSNHRTAKPYNHHPIKNTSTPAIVLETIYPIKHIGYMVYPRRKDVSVTDRTSQNYIHKTVQSTNSFFTIQKRVQIENTTFYFIFQISDFFSIVIIFIFRTFFIFFIITK